MMFASTVKQIGARFGVTIRRHAGATEYSALLDWLQPVTTNIPLIRVGGDGDGGYLVPDDLVGVDACFSPGVGDVIGFESDMVGRGIMTFQIDGSIDHSPLNHPLNKFDQKFLGFETRGQDISLDDWVASKMPATASNLVLQMDIEGGEWLALAAASSATLRRFRIIVLELHWLEYLFETIGHAVMRPILERLMDMFHVVHLHPNNCNQTHARSGVREIPHFLEVTLLRKDRAEPRGKVSIFPNPLDRSNVPEFPPVELPRSMFR